MELEWAIEGVETDARYPFQLLDRSGAAVVDWKPMVRTILEDLQRQVPVGLIAAMAHNTLAESIVAVARRVGEPRVVLSGGCFQNAYLLERTVRRLDCAGLRPYWHQRIPPNDGGIALGQIVAAVRSAASGQPGGADHPDR
jgi:hydrogenase maturation protein HypF